MFHCLKSRRTQEPSALGNPQQAQTYRIRPPTMAPKVRSKSLSGRTHRAKSLPGPLHSPRSPTGPPRKPTPFKLGRIKPSDVSICKACKTPILNSPPPPPTPKLTQPARSHLEYVLQTSLLQAHGRTANIQSAYASASKDYTELGNKDRTGPKSDFFEGNLEPGWRHAPYTDEVCKITGTLYGELSRALATSQNTVTMLRELLETERLRLQAGETEESTGLRIEEENRWFKAQHHARFVASLPKRRVRHKKKLELRL